MQSILTKCNTTTESTDTSNDKVTTSEEPATKKPHHLRRHSSGCMMLDQLLSDICNTFVTSDEQVYIVVYCIIYVLV